jgi:hypothetical protein
MKLELARPIMEKNPQILNLMEIGLLLTEKFHVKRQT